MQPIFVRFSKNRLFFLLLLCRNTKYGDFEKFLRFFVTFFYAAAFYFIETQFYTWYRTVLQRKDEKMKFKRPASAMLAAAMLVSSTAIVSYAAEDAEMKAALTVAKERIDIPETFTEFNHHVRTNYGNKAYVFSWSAPDGSGAINAEVCGKVITNYTSNREDFAYDVVVASDGASIAVESKPYTFGKLTKEELIRKATAAIKKLNPTVAKKIAVDPDGVRISLYGNDAYVTVNRVENGVKIAGQNGSVCLDKNTGEMTRFYLSWIPGAGFRDSKEAIKKSAAQEGFQAAFPIEMRYVAEYDWKTQEYTPHLIFHRTEFGQIDAFTGKKATFEESYDYYENGVAETESADMDMDDANPATGGPITFTEQEIAKMELEDRLIKPEQKLAEMIESGIWSIPKNAEVSDYHTYFNSRSNAYMLRASLRADAPVYESIDIAAEPYDAIEPLAEEEVMYEQTYYGSVTFNAETGEILSFYGSDPHGKRTLKSEKKAMQLIGKYFKEIAGDKAKDFPMDSAEADCIRTGNGSEADLINTFSVSSNRYVNGIACDPESASISLDASERINAYNMNYLGLDYPKPENVLETDAVYKKYFDQIKYELLYRVAYNNQKKRVETALVYNADAELYLDAFSGTLVNGNGGARPVKKPDHYTDLGGNDKLRAAAEKLALYNVTLMDEKGRLNADKAITREDFSNLVRSIGVYYYEPSEKSQKTLTRKYAAKILTEQYSDIAELPGLFSSSFSDVPADDKYVGYIAIAAAKGYMKGESGKFRPAAKMTRGEALMLVYDYLSR